MALARDKVGTVYPAYAYEVSRAKIHEYATAIGETDPRYLSDGGDCVAPPTFAACFTLIQGGQAALADPALGAHERMVHSGQDFELGPRPLRPGDVLDCTPRIADISARMGNELLTIEVDCRLRDGGDRAVLSRITLVLLPEADGR